MPYSALSLFLLITVSVRSVSVQLHIPHPFNKISNATLNQVLEHTDEISPSKIVFVFLYF